MAAALYNGKCYFGTLPMANVFRMDTNQFTYFGNLDNDPSTYLRRVWSMSTHNGQLFAGTRYPLVGAISQQCARAKDWRFTSMGKW